KASKPLAGMTGPKSSIDNGMGAAFGQIHGLQLGKSGLTAVTVMPSKNGDVFGRIGEVFNGAINGHQTQTKAKGARSLGRGHGATQSAEQGSQWPCPQLIAPIREGTGFGQPVVGVGPDEAETASELAHHVSDRQMSVPIDRNDHPYGHDHIKFALALGLDALLLQHRFDGIEGHGSLQGLYCQRVTEFALGFDLAEGVSHEVAPWLLSSIAELKSLPEKAAPGKCEAERFVPKA